MDKTKKKNKIFNFLKANGLILLLDIIAVNLSYLIALHLRFFVHGEFRESVEYYLDYFWRFAPIYTVVAIAVFFLFRLYGGLRQYAGLNDLNRIIKASIVTTILYIIISVISLALIPEEKRHVYRMPYSYYIIGAVLQFIYVAVIRFARRIIDIEKNKIGSRKTNTIPALVIGSSDLGQKVKHHLENNTAYRPVAIAGEDSGCMMDGIPVIAFDEIEKQIKEKDIKAVFIADKDLDKEQRDYIKQISEELELSDFTGYMSNQTGFLPLTNLLDVMEMPIVVDVDGKEQKFSSAEECLSTLPGEYDVIKVQATKLILKKREEDTSWMEVYQEQTGHEVSYF